MNKKVIISLLVVVLFVVGGLFFWQKTGNTSEMLHPTTKYAIWAALLGGLSAISLPLGSLAGIVFKPRASITAAFTAFGAGALMAALSVELIAPTVMEIVGQSASSTGMAHDKTHAFYTLGALILGCILGGLLFFTLDEALNSKGGFKRKISTVITFFKAKKGSVLQKHQILEGEDILDSKELKEELNEETKKEHSSGAMAIWLGLLIDGIPESFVIGAGFLSILSVKLAAGTQPEFGDLIPYTLIAGLFLSNFPEALGSSIGMKKQGMGTGKILLLWLSLVILVAIGSTVGYYVGAEVPHEVEIGIEGLAAGAMLTMIAQTMIPEAVHIGGARVVGLSTLIGYLSAVAFKLFE
ncbi:MAG: ZIP family metal transporter [Bacteroidia bacterium]